MQLICHKRYVHRKVFVNLLKEASCVPNNFNVYECTCAKNNLHKEVPHTYIHTYNLYLYTIKISKLTSLWGRVLIGYIKTTITDKNNSYKI